MSSLRSPRSIMNSTNYSLPVGSDLPSNQTFSPMHVPEEIFLALCLFTLVENILVVVAIMKNHNLHSPMYYFLCCLAISDMLVSISHLAESMFMFLLKHGIIAVNRKTEMEVDNLFDMMICCSVVSSLSFLAAVAVDRYITIFYALRYHNIMTHRRVVTAIAGIWLASTVCSVLFIIYSEKREVILCLIGFFISMMVLMVALYIHMFVLARRHARSISTLQMGKRRRVNLHQTTVNMKGAITLSILLGIFFLCWGPFFLHLILILSCPKHFLCLSYFKYFNIYIILIICNSVIDPLIYAFRSQELRKTLKDIALCSW
ncbi:melanocyte-stimulating hormone receptor [Spea bombifrons]|uniref:melanocyte-stimulating hormone receptor n=1 Tax=Spea bombifrons TaxID=233779 RepID=UPI00234BF9B6|nr:melanocyte-stimulating hormone receptor [Spea bombifrons]